MFWYIFEQTGFKAAYGIVYRRGFSLSLICSPIGLHENMHMKKKVVLCTPGCRNPPWKCCRCWEKICNIADALVLNALNWQCLGRGNLTCRYERCRVFVDVVDTLFVDFRGWRCLCCCCFYRRWRWCWFEATTVHPLSLPPCRPPSMPTAAM
jgi:hypothetical protein